MEIFCSAHTHTHTNPLFDINVWILQFVLNLSKHSHVLKVSHIFTWDVWNGSLKLCFPLSFLISRVTEAHLVGRAHLSDSTESKKRPCVSDSSAFSQSPPQQPSWQPTRTGVPSAVGRCKLFNELPGLLSWWTVFSGRGSTIQFALWNNFKTFQSVMKGERGY